MKNRLLRWKSVRQLIRLIRQGFSPRKLAQSVTLGFVLGVIPAFGFITPVCTGLALWWRLNTPLVLAVLYAVLPLQIVLLLPFFQLGISLFDLPPLPIALDQLADLSLKEWWHMLGQIGVANLAAVAVWAMLSVPGGLLIYGLSYRIIAAFKKDTKTETGVRRVDSTLK